MRQQDETEKALEHLFELAFSHLASKNNLEIDTFLLYVENLIRQSKGE